MATTTTDLNTTATTPATAPATTPTTAPATGTAALDTAAQNQAQGAITANATTNTAATTTSSVPATNAAKGATGTPTFNTDYLNNYITSLGGGVDHTPEIESMYKGLLDNNLAQLEAANKINQSEYEANRQQLVEDYNKQVNASAVDYERNRYNQNLQASMNGLNVGTGSQMSLALGNQNQQNQNALRSAQIKAQADIDRAVSNLNVQYQADISSAIANNDYQKAAALYQDKLNREEQMLNYYNTLTTEISTRASYGDFSMMKEFYGDEAADVAKQYWSASNPDAAYKQGYITAGEYHNLTGEWPYGYDPWGSGSGSGSGTNTFNDSWYAQAMALKDTHKGMSGYDALGIGHTTTDPNKVTWDETTKSWVTTP